MSELALRLNHEPTPLETAGQQKAAGANASTTGSQAGNSTGPGAATAPTTAPTVPLQGALPTPVTH